ncbi:MAG: DNA internalization-related competence protein ComEC/Rec2, partial [Candidatus Competibacterales bacterium]|nr:DNA internalization-related competence protein ComEC/Rec2 [Candidatus Competibacterales bacterium]
WADPDLPRQLPPSLERADIRVEGWIAGLPRREIRRTRFELTVDRLWHDGEPLPWRGRLRLSWYEEPPPELHPGDRWRLTVRLRRPRGRMNPGGFDYEGWLYRHNIAATGYVRTEPAPLRLATAERYPLDRYRQQLAADFGRWLAGNPYRGLLTALAMGDRQYIDRDQWQVLTATGTGHLLAISGLHIGLVAGLVFWLLRRLWARVPGLALRWPAPKAAALGALIAATGYALLAGLSLPTQRALLMLAIALLAVLRQRPVTPARLLATALLAVLLLDPAAPLAGGFWLSFCAVAVIIYRVAGRWPGRLAPHHWPGLQLAILLALAPVTLSLFQQLSLLAPLANLFAIPWTSLMIVPYTLLAVALGALSDTLAAALLAVAGATTHWLWLTLEGLAALDWARLSLPQPRWPALLFALPGILLLLGPRGLPGRWLGLPLCLPLVLAPVDRPASGQARFTLLDVGSGLAAVVETASHVLVYDTGPWHSPDFDGGSAALVPFLRHAGHSRVDVLIVSHDDRQHSGGVRSLREALPVTRILTMDPAALPITGAGICRAGQHWRWDGVDFRLLHPPVDTNLRGDDRGCVLRVEAGDRRLLLTADLEAAGLRALLPEPGQVDVLVAPHQGRRELPVPALLDVTRTRYVLFSTGHGNRWHYPRPATRAQYRASGARLLDTADSGALRFELGPDVPL